MNNVKIVSILRQIGFLLEMNDEDESPNIIFKIRSYKRASDTIANLSSNIEDIYAKHGVKGLMEIPSIGKAIALKIEEYFKTGKVQYLEELRSDADIDIEGFYGLEGVGPKTIKLFYDQLGIRDLSSLERAASEGRLRELRGFSKKKEELIIKKIQMFKKGRKRFLLGDVYPLIKQIESRLLKFGADHVAAAGSFRRMKETVGDIDFVVVSKDVENVTNYFTSMPEVAEILSKGSAKAFVRLNNNLDADLLVVPEESFGSALQYFTGSKDHGVAMRKLALSKGLHLNEWGVFDSSQNRIPCSSEEDVYRLFGLEWIPPEMRENKGEIQLARRGEGKKLPNLINYNDLKGDLQVHSNSTDGTMSIQDMALAASQRFGLQYIAITDHTKGLKLTNGLDETQLLHQANRIEELNDRIINTHDDARPANASQPEFTENGETCGHDFQILSAAEVNIMKDGSLDISSNVLDKLDIVGAAIHSNFSLPIEIQTDRLIKAAKNPSVDIIFHPTGRRINKREGYPVDIEKLVDVAKDTKTVLEIDAHYDRLDLKDEYIRMAVQKDVRLVIDSDAHHPIHYAFLKFGIGQARRGWAEKSDILNTKSADELLKALK